MMFFIPLKEWASKVDCGEIKEAPNQEKGFLLFGQELNVKVIFDNRLYHAYKWARENFVTLEEVEVKQC